MKLFVDYERINSNFFKVVHTVLPIYHAHAGDGVTLGYLS